MGGTSVLREFYVGWVTRALSFEHVTGRCSHSPSSSSLGGRAGGAWRTRVAVAPEVAPLVSNPKTVASSLPRPGHEAPFFVRSAVSAVMQGEIQAVSADQGRDTDCNGSVPNLSNMMDDSTLDTTTAPGKMDIGDRGEPKSHSAQAACLRPFREQKVPLPIPYRVLITHVLHTPHYTRITHTLGDITHV